MKIKKYTAFAVAMAMAVSCLGAFLTSEGTEAAITLEEGKVWGMGVSVDDEKLIEFMLLPETDGDEKEYPLVDENGSPITNKAQLIEYLKKNPPMPIFSVEELDFSASIGQYMLFEVASRDSGGYVLNFAVSMLVKANIAAKGTLDMGAALDFDLDDSFVMGSIMLGTVSTDADLFVKKISVTTDVFMTLKGDNELLVGGETPRGFEKFHGAMDMGFAVGYDSITEFTGDSFKLFTEIDDEKEYPVKNVNSELYSHIFAYGNVSAKDVLKIIGHIDSFDTIDDRFFKDIEFDLSMATFTKKNAQKGEITVERDIDEIGYDFDGIGIVTPFGGNDLEIEFGIGEDDDDDDDFGIRDLDPIYEKGFVLTGDNVAKVKNGVSDAIRAYEEGIYGKEVTVKVSKDETYKKEYGKPIGAYGGETPEGKKFVGWNVGKGSMHLISEDFILKSNVEARPVFATEYALAEVTADGFDVGDGVVYVKIDNDDAPDIPKSVLTAVKNKGGVLVIEGADYKWVLTGDELGKGGLNPAVEGKEWKNGKRFAKQNVVQLSFKASGKMPDGTKVTYDSSGKFTSGALVDVYVMNDDGTMEFIGSYHVGESGNVEFDVPHCSEYLLVQNSMPTHASAGEKEDFPLLLVAVAAGVIIVAIAIVFYIRK